MNTTLRSQRGSALLVGLLVVALLLVVGFAVYQYQTQRAALTTPSPSPSAQASTSAGTYNGSFYTLKYDPSVIGVGNCGGQGGASKLFTYVAAICEAQKPNNAFGSVTTFKAAGDYVQQYVDEVTTSATKPMTGESVTSDKAPVTANGTTGTMVTMKYNYTQDKTEVVAFLFKQGDQVLVIDAGAYPLGQTPTSAAYKAVDAMARSVKLK
jgi:hypothetical protein